MYFFCLSGCGGVLTDSEGSFSSPNHPGSYPPNLLCVWVIRVPPPYLVQIHISSLTVEGPSPCLFDWLEVQEQIEQSSVVTRLVKSSQGICQFPFRTQQRSFSSDVIFVVRRRCTLHFTFLVACRFFHCTQCHSGEE